MSEYGKKLERIEDELVSQVSGSKLMEYTAGVAQWVRISGTQDEIESLKYCQALLDKMGYETELSFHKGFISVPVSAFVEMEAPKHMSFRALTPPFSPSTPVIGLKGEIVEADAQAVSGKLVLAKGLPNVFQIHTLQNAGAIGVIYAQDAELHNMPTNPLWGSPTEKTEGLLPKIPVASVTRPDGAVIADAIRAGGRVVVRMETVVDTGWRRIPLLLANAKSRYSDKYLLFSGHIDSWDYGAMDNGAANATMLECARVLITQQNKFRRGLRLAFWAGHSQGKFFGSSWYADNHFEELCEQCVGHVYVDSTGGKDAVIIDEAPVMPQTKGLAGSVIKKQTGQDFIGKRIGHFADQSFFGVGLTSVFGTFSEQDDAKNKDVLSFREGATVRAGGLGWWWHTDKDTLDKVDEANLVRDTKIYTGVIWRLLSQPVLPYDFTAAVEEMRQTVKGLSSGLQDKFDFAPMLQRMDVLYDAVEKLNARIAAIDEPCEEADVLNELLQKLSIQIVRIAFHAENEFDFDLSGEMFPIPSLTDGKRLFNCAVGSHRYYMLRTQLQRGYNRVMSHLKAAVELLKEV